MTNAAVAVLFSGERKIIREKAEDKRGNEISVS